MAGYSRIYVLGGLGGFMGADGVNPIDMMILLGEGSRQWLEPVYVDTSIRPLGALKTIVPEGPGHPNSLIDACLAFAPQYFRDCPSLPEVEAALSGVSELDFDAYPKRIPKAWRRLRNEARETFSQMGVWQADLIPTTMRPDMSRMPIDFLNSEEPGQ